MKLIPLTRGQFALVDDADYEWLNQWKWHYETNGYASRRVWVKGGNSDDAYIVKMHRLIMGAGKGQVVDHINANGEINGLNNQRYNLRVCTQADNCRNVRLRSTNTSGYKGVWLHDRKQSLKKPWRAAISVSGKRIRLGNFADKRLAAIAYNEAAEKYHGEFARLNQL